ncbi:MAG: hypothetical protein HUJ72_09935 [Blautia sp.]|nr:hypothetical protein [Blautia sp.]
MKAADRDVYQIRYPESSPLCAALRQRFGSPDANQKDADTVEIWTSNPGIIEIRCAKDKNGSIKEDFLKYLGAPDSLYGYQKSYKLVFYRCYFQEALYEERIRMDRLTKQFRQFYLDRKRSGLLTEYEGSDEVVITPEKGTVDEFLSLIMRNPFNAISKKGFFCKEKIDGTEYFAIRHELYESLDDQDLENIRDIVFKKLELYYSKEQREQETEVNHLASVAENVHKAWLLTWNPQHWNWDDYAAGIEASRFGESYQVTWSCANTHVEPGDAVYLMLLGNNGVRGIIAAGKAISKVFEVPHWDYKKAAKGQKTNSIKVSFEKILDFRTDQILRIEPIQEAFPDQKWNPQGSGITIQDQYVAPLKALWERTVNEDRRRNVSDLMETIRKYLSEK